MVEVRLVVEIRLAGKSRFMRQVRKFTTYNSHERGTEGGHVEILQLIPMSPLFPLHPTGKLSFARRDPKEYRTGPRGGSQRKSVVRSPAEKFIHTHTTGIPFPK